MAGASVNNIKTRMKSVSSTMQITKAMELVATSKLRRAKERAEATRAFADAAENVLSGLLSSAEAKESPYVTPGGNGATLYVVIAGDRGLAGGYNSNIFRLVGSVLREGDMVLPLGKRTVDYYARRGVPCLSEDYTSVAALGVGASFHAAREVCRAYLGGRVSRVVLVYTRFVSVLTQVPTVKNLLPLSAAGNDAGENGGRGGEPVIEADGYADMFEAFVPDFVGGLLYAAVCESEAAECGARRTAMSSAGKNATDMMDRLMLRYNRARQAAITQEITEIVSGAEAL